MRTQKPATRIFLLRRRTTDPRSVLETLSSTHPVQPNGQMPISIWILMQRSSILIAHALPAYLHSRPENGGVSKETMTTGDCQQKSVLSALLPRAHLPLSGLRAKVVQHKPRSRSGPSKRSLARDRRDGERNTKYAGKVHGCCKVS